ncbi:MAG: beta-L-arabinofuranosidase domain-containing protein [Bacteriovoracia bacterium]
MKSRKILIIVLIVVVLGLSAAGLWFQLSSQTSLYYSIANAGHALQEMITDSGKFVYRVNLNPKVKLRPKYNVLRHLGSIYSLQQLRTFNSSLIDEDKLKASIKFIVQETFRSTKEGRLGVWSCKVNKKQKKRRCQIKLGALGLALTALAPYYQRYPNIYTLEQLKSIGDFILALQKDDGSFYSKYYPGRGPSDKWTSLYYPGEAALGLIKLYKVTDDDKYMKGALKALKYLSKKRHKMKLRKIPVDHWALIATGELFEMKRPAFLNEKDKELIQEHAYKIIFKILKQQIRKSYNNNLIGGFNRSGNSTPTSTRLEGLIAMYPFIDNPKFKKATKAGIKKGIDFLLTHQEPKGRFKGAWTRSVISLPENVGKKEFQRKARKFNLRATEIRIDYIQHALSALIGAAKSDIEFGK